MVAKSFRITTLGHAEPGALHTALSSNMFTLPFFSIPLWKASNIGLVFGVGSGIFFLLTFFAGVVCFSKHSARRTGSPIPASFTFPVSEEHNTLLSLWPSSCFKTGLKNSVIDWFLQSRAAPLPAAGLKWRPERVAGGLGDGEPTPSGRVMARGARLILRGGTEVCDHRPTPAP